MDTKRVVIVVWLIILSTIELFSQNVSQPIVGLKSHETLDIIKVEVTSQKTLIYMIIENKITGGTFCADKNIFIVYPDGSRSRMASSDGIPVCPDTYKFNSIGQRLEFVLTFPALKQSTEWIDLIEECSENCFSLYGITLDNILNKKIDEAFVLAESKVPVMALDRFIDILNEIDNKNQGVEGLLYINIIKLAKETGNLSKASEWYLKLKSSDAPGLTRYIKYLNDQGIIF